jgi:Zn-dependent peptidase ImmA (M78 family)
MKTQESKEIFARRLIQARSMKGVSLRDLARATGDKISYNALHRYEQGIMMPGDDVLIPLADALDQPLDFFFRPFTVKLERLEFRKKARLGVKALEAIREQASNYFERYLEVERILGVPDRFKDPLGDLRLGKPEDAELAAEHVRTHWNLGRDPLPNVLETLEAHGVKVFEVEAPESFDGFSGWADGRPIVVLAKWLDRDVSRKRFTALHEIAHVLLHPHSDVPEAEREKVCHRFAGAMLMPKDVFEADWGGHRRRISLEELEDLKRRYGISIAAIMRRALDLGLIDSSLYRRFCIIQKSHDWHHQEPGKYSAIEISRRFEQLVLRAMSEEIISVSKGAGLLGVPIDDLRGRLSNFA